jgi:phosphotransferase system enzyme I (PtsP)
MITSISEVEESLYLLHRSLHEVQEEEQVKINMPRVGVMIEVPSVLTMMDELAELVDFFSVGSNDLTQYLLAVDRNNPRVAGLYSYFHPAVLRTLNQLVIRCRELDRPISLCGEMAGDPSTAILMMAMGFNSLSMSSSNLLKVRKTLIHTPLSEAQVLLSEVLKMDNPAVIRSWVERYMQNNGLGSMVRPGPTNLSTN